MNYNWSFDVIPKGIQVAFEIGSRDLLDGISIKRHFGCKVFSFECNPHCIQECRKNQSDDVVLVEKAVSQIDGQIEFNSFDLEKYNNMGASSIFEIDFLSRHPHDGDYGKTNVQKTIQVPSVRLDTFCNQYNIIPDVIFMDVQEAELEVLKSASHLLQNVKYIVTEVSTKSTYKGGCDSIELNDFMVQNNFSCISHDASCLKRTQYFAFLDVIYKNNLIVA